jgi:hypothetical protein
LERRTSRAGRDSIDHVPGSFDDVCNSVAGAAVLAAQAAARPRTKIVSPLFWSKNAGWIGDGQANTPPPPGYQRRDEPWRDFVGPDAVYSHWPGSGPREW